MKTKRVTLLLCFALASPPPPRAQASTQVVFCVGVGIAAIAAIIGVKIFAQRCKTHYYCVRSTDAPTQYCRSMTKGAAANLGTNIVSGPYELLSACNGNCPEEHTNGVAQAASPLYNDGSDFPEYVIVERSIDNMKTWQQMTIFFLDPNEDSQEVYHDTEPGLATAFYRFRYDEL